MNNLYFTDISGNSSDFNFYQQRDWMSESAVIDNLTYRRGEWKVELIYANKLNPLQFIKRTLSSHSCLRQAAQRAYHMRQMATKALSSATTGTLNQASISFN
ncbi:hypothetical protein [Spirosoma sp. KNUC1025]|uniref:hypothetical protein n=1 Tax=Spirosoma sp. KNUC1025 TaxID=2894082 RepID=UPI00386934DF|nr:hypothetical protein LN737_23500 [Spirosoma sp. KNUC1025]